MAFRYFRDLFGIIFRIFSTEYLQNMFQVFLPTTSWCPSAMRPWESCPTQEPLVQSSTWPTTTSSSWRPSAWRRRSSCRSCSPATTWTSSRIPAQLSPNSSACSATRYRSENISELKNISSLKIFQCNQKNIRLVVMNNLLPSSIKLHLKFDLKGSTYKRKVGTPG